MFVPKDNTKIENVFLQTGVGGVLFFGDQPFSGFCFACGGRGYMLDDLRVIFRTRGKTLFPDARIGTLPVADFAVN